MPIHLPIAAISTCPFAPQQKNEVEVTAAAAAANGFVRNSSAAVPRNVCPRIYLEYYGKLSFF
jgi:hypothetical protein